MAAVERRLMGELDKRRGRGEALLMGSDQERRGFEAFGSSLGHLDKVSEHGLGT